LDGVIYVGNQGVLYALNPTDGSMLWNITTGGELAGLGVAISPIDGTLYLTYDGGYLGAFSPKGKELWMERPVHGNMVNYFGSPLVDPRGNIHLAGFDNVAVVAPNGTVLLATRGGACDTCPLNPTAPTFTADGTIFASASSAGVPYVEYMTALHPNGSVKWTHSYPNHGAILVGDPAMDVTNSVVYFSAVDGLYAMNISNGAMLWNYTQAGFLSTGVLCPCPPPMDYGRMLMACWIGGK